MSLDPDGVWLDAQGAQRNPGRGISRYVVEHVRALLRVAPEAIGGLRVNPAYPLPSEWDGLELPPPIAFATAPEQAAGGPAIYHVMSPFEGLVVDEVWPPWARGSAQRTVVTLYDLIPHLLADRYLPNKRLQALYEARLKMIQMADHIVALSASTAADAVDHLGVESRRITVIEAGVSERLPSLVASPEVAAELLARELPAVRPGFILYVGGPDPRKNLEGLVAAYGRLPERLRAAHQLVVAGSLEHEGDEPLRSWLAGAGLGADEVLLTGFVADEQLVALYRACELFVFPSLYEGFGLPIVEAAACGAAVIASRRSSSAEVLGDLRGSFEPDEPAEIAAAIESALSDRELAAALRARSQRLGSRFSWERVAERTATAYERALAAPPRRERSVGRTEAVPSR